MNGELWIALFLLACVLLIAAVVVFDRWWYLRLVAAEREVYPLLTVVLDDPTDDDETPEQCEPELDAAPTLREERVVLYGAEYPHVCLPGCPDRPTVYLGPVVQGRRGEVER